MGWRRPFTLCINTEPSPKLEASVVSSKGRSYWGKMSTGASVIAVFNVSKASCACLDHSNLMSLHNMAVSGTAISRSF